MLARSVSGSPLSKGSILEPDAGGDSLIVKLGPTLDEHLSPMHVSALAIAIASRGVSYHCL